MSHSFNHDPEVVAVIKASGPPLHLEAVKTSDNTYLVRRNGPNGPQTLSQGTILEEEAAINSFHFFHRKLSSGKHR